MPVYLILSNDEGFDCSASHLHVKCGCFLHIFQGLVPATSRVHDCRVVAGALLVFPSSAEVLLPRTPNRMPYLRSWCLEAGGLFCDPIPLPFAVNRGKAFAAALLVATLLTGVLCASTLTTRACFRFRYGMTAGLLLEHCFLFVLVDDHCSPDEWSNVVVTCRESGRVLVAALLGLQSGAAVTWALRMLQDPMSFPQL
jgi:hypothetical protein